MKRFINHIARFSLLILVLSVSCVDPISFDTGSEPRRLVVDGLISDVSFNERTTLNVTPEYFTLRLRWTGPVNNLKDEVISNASVTLHDDLGNEWSYFWLESLQQYILPYDDFQAEAGRKYFVRIMMGDGNIYESEPQSIKVAPALDELEESFETRLQEIQVGEQTEFLEQRGVTLSVDLPEHSPEETFYYRWKVTPSWVYVAPLPANSSPVKTCYVTNQYYFEKINVRLDRSGGYAYDLFFLPTEDNQRIIHDFTAFVTQYSLNEEAFNFWNELALQQESGGGIFDPPPFELSTNIRNVNDPDEKVSGFFIVASESSMRWYINIGELPYNLAPPADPCLPPPGIPNIPTPDCSNCLEYRGGSTYNTNVKPDWWREY